MVFPIPEPPVPAPEPAEFRTPEPPPAPPVTEEPRAASKPLAEEVQPRPDLERVTPPEGAEGAASRGLRAAWAASIALLIGGGLAAIIQRDAVMAAWPPAARLFGALGLGWGGGEGCGNWGRVAPWRYLPLSIHTCNV